MTGRDREPDFLGEFGHGDAAIGLQMAEDFAVDGVQGMHWYEPLVWWLVLGNYPKTSGYAAKI